MAQNAQHKRVRKNRVSITYDVETNGATETKELPFVMGVIGDYAGDKADKDIAENRQFTTIDKDNFDDVLRRTGPELNLKVDNVLQDDESEFEVNLDFKSMKDFEPDAIVEKVEPLRKLAETREQLQTLLAKADKSRDLEKLLKEVLQDQEMIDALAADLGVESEGSSE